MLSNASLVYAAAPGVNPRGPTVARLHPRDTVAREPLPASWKAKSGMELRGGTAKAGWVDVPTERWEPTRLHQPPRKREMAGRVPSPLST